ncbi:MAG: TetR/AcrR family transcriptional regulator, partial [Sinobacterium sp.]|nr:TetR/AcrR family transcriptional regulator [Sinobacterium sp.]
MPSNQEITNSTKTALLNAAINSLCSVGFTATTAVKICKSANVSRGSFHYHYPKGRTDIFMEIIHVTWQRVLKNQHNSAIPQAKRLMATFSEMEADEEFYKLMTAYNQIWQASELKFKDALVFVEA